MKTIKEIKKRIDEIKEILRTAEQTGMSKKILSFSDYRGYHRELNVLDWVVN